MKSVNLVFIFSLLCSCSSEDLQTNNAKNMEEIDASRDFAYIEDQNVEVDMPASTVDLSTEMDDSNEKDIGDTSSLNLVLC